MAEFMLPSMFIVANAELQARDLLPAREAAKDNNAIANLEPSLNERDEYAYVTTCAKVNKSGKKGRRWWGMVSTAWTGKDREFEPMEGTRPSRIERHVSMTTPTEEKCLVSKDVENEDEQLGAR